MTPEEKALNLVHNMYFAHGEVSMAQAKQCALIAVNELIEVTESIQASDYYYWQEVKQEIEKL